ncbi:MAG TPA: DUF5947 family protein [Pirellulales bacterium]|jgi:hypothetical protein|nr:DUF5947 family protein [Pirellulales bacterium]
MNRFDKIALPEAPDGLHEPSGEAAPSSSRRPWAALRAFTSNLDKKPTETCGLCSLGLASEHQHLIQPEERRLVCVCDACALLFDDEGRTQYRRVPRDSRALPDFRLTDSQWDALQIPIGLAFFFHSVPAARIVAIYPSPAGATESLLSLEAWQSLADDNAALAALRPDVEALLVNRLGAGRGFTDPQYFITPIDECYKLVGLMRSFWRGLSGGSDVWDRIREFFARLSARAKIERGPAATDHSTARPGRDLPFDSASTAAPPGERGEP